jgi:hypothetical protein
MAINPLQTPINYAVDVQSPFQAALGGLQIGVGLEQMDVARQKRAMEMQQLQAAQAGQAELRNLFNNPNATSADYARVSAFLPKDQAAIVTQGFERKTKEQQQADLRMGAEVYSAVKSGNIDVAKQRLTDKATALRNSGRESDAKAAENSLELINLNPTAAQATIGLYMARLPGGTDFLANADKALSTLRSEQLQPSALATAEAASTKAVADAQRAFAEAEGTPQRLVTEQQLRDAQAAKAATEARVAQATAGAAITQKLSEAEKARVEAQFAEKLAQGNVRLNDAQIKNITSQINDRAANLRLNEQTMLATVAEKLAKVGEVPADTRKLVNDSAVAAAASKQAAGQYNDLAQRLEAEGGGFGVFSNASELAKRGLGLQGGMSALRQEYTRIRNSAAIKSLPQGAASDADIALALKPFPPDTADAKYMASFLRGMAKLQDIDASVANAKTDWLASNNGSLTRANKRFIAGDYAANPGETFSDFTQRVVTDVAQRYRSPAQLAEERRQQTIGQIPTNAAPAAAPTAPAASAANVMSQADAILRGGR